MRSLPGRSPAAARDLDSGVPAPVLIVDDNPAKRLALRAALAPLGYPVVEAESGRAALRCLMEQEFAVILLDVRMPVMDGFETASLIRLRRQSESTAIIFITAFSRDEVLEPALYAQDAVDVIYAPVAPELLRAKVQVFARLFARAEDLARRAADMEASAAHLTMLTDAAPVGIYQTDEQNNYVYTNPRWSEITGLEAADAVGRRWDEIIEPTSRARMNAELPRSPGSWSRQRVELRSPGSASVIGMITCKPLTDRDGGITGWMGTLANVTLEAQREMALLDARDDATAATRLKSDFLANMSHEIRTPMNGVIGMTDLLLETDLDPRQRDYVATVAKSGRALLTVVDDILDFSKVEAGKVELEQTEFSPRAIVEDVADLLGQSAQAKGVELMTFTDRSVSTVVRGDGGRVRQVLMNLVGNAIKFTQRGQVVVRVREDDPDGNEALIRFEVADSGDGIPAEKLDLIFEPFVQVDTSPSRRYAGTGLGLAISGRLIALMGGRRGVTSTLGEGSLFWFTIRVERVARQVSDGRVPADPGLTGVRVLVADDNPTHRAMLTQTLGDWGMQVTAADSGDRALAELRAAAETGTSIDLALLDGSLPEMAGFGLVNTIAAEPALTARLMVMTDLGQERDHGTPDSRVCAALSKPIRPENLRRALRQALAPATEGRPSVPASSPVASPSGGSAGRLLLAEDNLINQQVAIAMLSSAGYWIHAVPNGADAVAAVAAAERPYDAILMDCQMPELNGYEATARIRAREHGARRTPIIAMTAGARAEDRERCLQAGMDSYLAKPFNKHVLLALVGSFMNHEEPPRAAILDTAVFDELATFGEDYLAGLVDQFHQETCALFAELRDAARDGDHAAVRRIAHSVKGSSSQIGGLRLAQSCAELEQATAEGGAPEADRLPALQESYDELYRAMGRRLRAAAGGFGFAD